jgi:glycosyltransferase involved in cell wall biosynthesis
VGGIPELIEDGVNGLLCPPADVACLADRISLMIDRADLRQRLGQEARRTYERSGFDARSIAEHLASAYTRAIRETRTQV